MNIAIAIHLGEQNTGSHVIPGDVGNAAVSNNERVRLEMKIMRYRRIARQMATDPEVSKRIAELVAELERKLREIDE